MPTLSRLVPGRRRPSWPAATNCVNRCAIERVRRGLPTKSVLMVGLRGVGKTVLLDRLRDDAEAGGIQTIRIVATQPQQRLAQLRRQQRGPRPNASTHRLPPRLRRQSKNSRALSFEIRER